MNKLDLEQTTYRSIHKLAQFRQKILETEEGGRLHIHVDAPWMTYSIPFIWNSTGHSWLGFEKGHRRQAEDFLVGEKAGDYVSFGVGPDSMGQFTPGGGDRRTLSHKPNAAWADPLLFRFPAVLWDHKNDRGSSHHVLELSHHELIKAIDYTLELFSKRPYYSFNEFQCTSYITNLLKEVKELDLNCKEYFGDYRAPFLSVETPKGLKRALNKEEIEEVEKITYEERFVRIEDMI